MSGPEQRRERRVDTQQQVWVEGQEMRVEAEARNISRSGMFVVTRNSLPPPGSTLEVKFDDRTRARCRSPWKWCGVPMTRT
jgi:hypothetical protein